MTGFINIDKGVGMSSAKVVAKIKRHTGVKKCGHMGTLDPLATGVLPIALNSATRLFDYLLDKEKVYEAEFTFGKTTDTLDRAGEICQTCKYIPTEKEITEAAKSLTGEIMQVPPIFSAKHVGGVRSYKLAASGKSVVLLPKAVKINYIKLIGSKGKGVYTFEISCGGGTYIRSIARDLGELTGSLAYMSALKRTKSGIFEIDGAITLDEFLQLSDFSKRIIPPQNAVDFESVYLDNLSAERLLNGIAASQEGQGLRKVFKGAEFLGIGEIFSGGLKLRSHIRQ